jgi:hypothetical protein
MPAHIRDTRRRDNPGHSGFPQGLLEVLVPHNLTFVDLSFCVPTPLTAGVRRMSMEFSVEHVNEHQYLMRTTLETGILESWIRADPDVIEDLGLQCVDESEIVRQTAVFLAGHQPVEDFPPMLDLVDVMARYEDYAQTIWHRLARRK